MFVAQERGLFARAGLEVELKTARDSTTQLADLADGRIDIAMSAFDNIVAYDERHAEADAIVAFLGVNNGGRSTVIAAPRIADIAALRGESLAVDSASSGYALVLRELLRRGGLEPRDYLFVSVGGSRQRWEALRAGRVAATLLNAPYDGAALDAGFRKLASSADVGRYQGSVGAVRRQWAEAHAQTLIAFIGAYVAAVDWLHAPENREAAIAILMKRLGIGNSEAARDYAELVAQPGGFAPHAAFDLEGARTVLKLRRTYAGGSLAEADLARFHDPRYYERALVTARQ
jgi:ABC-type nitrate/sulfonate/bicarbonate transport system substrate-binding protein